MMEDIAQHFLHLTGMMIEAANDGPNSTLRWCDDEFGLDLITDRNSPSAKTDTSTVTRAPT